MKLEYYSDVRDGNLQNNVRQLIAKELPRFEGKRVVITIDRVKSKRSNQQNRFYRGVIVPEQIECFFERWGERFDSEQIHDWNKANVWYEEKVNEETGEVFKIPASSTKIGKLEWEERLDKLRQFFWNSFDWKLSLPNEQKNIEI